MKSFHRRSSRPALAPQEPGRPVPVRHGRRVDQLLVDQGLAASRTLAQRLIAAGRVSWDGGVLLKAAQILPETVQLRVAEDASDRYVSRGALKLAGALEESGLDVQGRICLDVGQSTGGFTDCLLQAGAARVVGVDVGHEQLHGKLRADGRVAAYEGVNCRALQASDLRGDYPASGFDVMVGDVSFISLTLILPALVPMLSREGQMLMLVKPQFEVGPEGVGKGGIVRDPALYADVERKLRQCCAGLNLQVLGWFASAITGSDGNREFFIWTKHEC